MSRRWIAGLLATVMAVTILLPVSAFAEELSAVDSIVTGEILEQETDGNNVTAEQPSEEDLKTSEDAFSQENGNETADMAKSTGTEEDEQEEESNGKTLNDSSAVSETDALMAATVLDDQKSKVSNTVDTLDSLKAAVSGAAANQKVTITLGADIELDATLEVGENQNIELDLNGHRITVPAAVGSSIYAINNYGVLTVCDTSSGQTGAIASRGVGNYGTMYLHSGTIQSIDSNGGGAAVWNEGYLEMDGGKLEFTGQKTETGSGIPLNVQLGSRAVITGGELVSATSCAFVTGECVMKNITLTSSTDYWMTVKTYAPAVCTMENVTINTTNGGCVEVAGGTLNLKDCNFTQTVQGNPAWNSCALAVSSNGTVNVEGGTYTGVIAAAYVYNSGGTFNLKGGTFKSEGNVLKADYQDKGDGRAFAINVFGGDYQGAININANASLTVSGGTFDRELDEKYLADGFEMKRNEDGTFTTIASMAGEGTASDPYIISNLDQLKLFRDKVNDGENTVGKFYKLAADIDLAGEEWEPIGGTSTGIKFEGTFDGDGHTISNLKITRGTENISQNNQVGFFGACTSRAKLQNFTIKNVDVTGGLHVAAVLGGTGGAEAAISNVHVTGSVKVSGDSYVGGILGKGYSQVTGCSVEGDGTESSCVTGSYVYVGGIVGFMGEGSMVTSDCTVKNITISGKFNGIGGINGILHYGNTIRNCNLENVVVWQTTDPSEDNGRVYVGAFAGCYLDNDGKAIPTVENCNFEGILYSGRNKTDVTGPERSVGEVWYGTNYPCTLNLSDCTVVRTAPAPTPGQPGSNEDDDDTSVPAATPAPVATPVPTATARPTTVVSHSKPAATPAATAPVPTGSPVVTTTQVEATVAENTAVATVDHKQLTDAVNRAISDAKASDGVPVVKVEVAGTAEATAIEVTLPVQALDTLAKAPGAILTVTSNVAEVTFDTAALASIASQADEEVVLVVIPMAKEDMSDAQAEKVNGYPAFKLALQSGGKIISDFNEGEATVTLPYALAEGQQAEGVVVWYVEDNGNTTVCKTTYDSQTQKVTFVTPHFSLYAIAYDETLVADQTDAELPVPQEPVTQEPAQEGGMSLPIMIGIAAVVILVMVFAVRIFFAKKDSDRY